MKKVWTILVRLFFVLFVGITAYLMFTSTVRVNVHDTHEIAREVVRRAANESKNKELKNSVKIIQKSGLDNELLKSLPKSYHRNFSYVTLYDLSVSYQQNGELTAKNLGLHSDNRLEKLVNYFMVKEINQELKGNSKEVNHAINLFHYFMFGVALCFILAVLLILFGKYWVSLALLIATSGGFFFLQYFANGAVNRLESQLYTEMSLTTSNYLWFSLIIGIVITIVWPICLAVGRNKMRKK